MRKKARADAPARADQAQPRPGLVGYTDECGGAPGPPVARSAAGQRTPRRRRPRPPIGPADSLLPGWDLEAIADEILGVPRGRVESGRRTVRARRLYYSESELRQKSQREIPIGQFIQGYGYEEDGSLVFDGSAGFDDLEVRGQSRQLRHARGIC